MRWLHILQLVSLVSLAACSNGRSSHLGLTRFPPGGDPQLRSPKSRALNKAMIGHKCLPVDAIAREIGKDNTPFTIVTTNIDVGQIQTGTGADGCVQFQPIANPTARALVALKSTHLHARLESLAGNTIQSSEAVGDALSVSTQDACTSATLVKGDYQSSLAVVCKSGRQLTLKGTTAAGQILISYNLQPNALIVEKYVPIELEANCTSAVFRGQVARVTTRITWDADVKQVAINRDLATLFSKYLTPKNEELEQALKNPQSQTAKFTRLGPWFAWEQAPWPR